MHTKLVSSLVVLSMVTGAAAKEPAPWPQFRGPGGSGVAKDEHPPVEIGPDRNVKWKVPVPSGLSSPIIVGDKLILTALDDDKLFTIAYDRADGREIWRARAPANRIEKYHQTEGSPAASTPATDGERIVSYFGSCGVLCYDLEGNELWHYEMPMATTIAGFGSGVSPVLAEETVVLLRDVSNGPKIVALDVATGDVKWEKARESYSGFGTPAIWNTPTGSQVIAPGFRRMIAYDLHTGEEVWSVEGMPSAPCTTPVTADGNLFFAGWSPGEAGDEFQMPKFDALLSENNADADGDGVLSKEESQNSFVKDFFDNNDPNKDGKITREEWDGILNYMATTFCSAFAVKPGGRGDVSKSHVLWLQKKGLPYVASAIVYGGQYVMVKDGGIVTAYNADTGDEIYQKRALATGSYYASPVAAGGNIYFTSLTDGTVTVLAGGADKVNVVAKNEPLGERVSATPAIVDDTVYLRTAGHLYAFAEEQ